MTGVNTTYKGEASGTQGAGENVRNGFVRIGDFSEMQEEVEVIKMRDPDSRIYAEQILVKDLPKVLRLLEERDDMLEGYLGAASEVADQETVLDSMAQRIESLEETVRALETQLDMVRVSYEARNRVLREVIRDLFQEGVRAGVMAHEIADELFEDVVA